MLKSMIFLALFCLFTLAYQPQTASAYGSYYQNQLNSSLTAYNLTFSTSPYQEVVWINIPRRANVTSVNWDFGGYSLKPIVFENGTVFWDGSYGTDQNYSADSDWETYAKQIGGSSGLYMNYSFHNYSPYDVFTIIIRYGNNVLNNKFLNTTIPQSCFLSNGDNITTSISVWLHDCDCPYDELRIICWDKTRAAQIIVNPWWVDDVIGGVRFYESNITQSTYISNITIDIGNNGVKEYWNKTVWNTTGTIKFNSTQLAAVNTYLTSTCTSDWATGTCVVPFNITSATVGILGISAINVSGTYYNTVGTCGTFYTAVLNFSFRNETSLAGITANAEYTMDLLDTSNQEYNSSTGTVSSFAVCMLNGTYNVDMIIKYEKAGMGTRFYFLVNATLTGTVANSIALYLLDSSLGTTVDVTVQNVFGYPITGAYVQFQRYYIGENTYRTIAMLKTDDKGIAGVFLDINDQWYKYVITQNGEVPRVIGPSLITSTTLVLSTSTGVILTWEDYATGISYSCAYSTNYLTCTIANPSGLANQVCLDVDEYNVVNISNYDLQCGTGSSMTLISNLTDVASYNKTVRYMLYVVSPLVLLESGSFPKGGAIIYGLFGVLLTAIIFIVACGMGIWNPAVGMIMGVIGIITAVTLGLLNVPITALGSLIFVLIIIVYKVKT